MQTYSHLLITALAGDRLKKRGVALHSKAFLVGAALPDLPVIVLTIGFFISSRWLSPQRLPEQPLFGELYDYYFFHNPVWIVGHNTFHAPWILAGLGAVGFWGSRRGQRWGKPLLWLALGCALHTLLDIFTHHHDGPLLLFPFNWQFRYAAPVSYWDPRYGAWWFSPLEHLLNLAILIFWIGGWWQRRRAARSAQTSLHGDSV